MICSETKKPYSPKLERLHCKDRLRILEESALMDSSPEKEFDQLTELVCKILNVPVALVSLVDDKRQFFKSMQGVPEPWKSLRETPLSHSFCQHVVMEEQPLVVNNAPEHAIVCENMAVKDLNVIAYLGIPLKASNGMVLGSLCAIKSIPHEWSEDEIQNLSAIADLVMTEMELRHELKIRLKNEAKLRTNLEIITKLNQDLRAFGYMVSHDLKSPLNSIQGFLKIFMHDHTDGINEEGIDLLNRIHRASLHMNQLIVDTANYSQISADPCKLVHKEISLTEIFASVIDHLQTSIEQANAQIDIPENLPRVVGTKSLLVELFQNLVSNAIKYCEHQPEIKITTQTVGHALEIKIKDNGIGIDEKFLEKIFTPYKRLHSQHEYEGSGLGLAICSRIVEQHVGTISCESSENQGSTFTVKLPMPPK
ncbi:MAG: ATP-binding protein [Verrucomicrobiota bacterium]